VSSHWGVRPRIHDALDRKIQCNPPSDNDRACKFRLDRRRLSLRYLLLHRVRTHPVGRRWRSCIQPPADGRHVTCHRDQLVVLVYDLTRDTQHARAGHLWDVFTVRDVLHADVGVGILLLAGDEGLCAGGHPVLV